MDLKTNPINRDLIFTTYLQSLYNRYVYNMMEANGYDCNKKVLLEDYKAVLELVLWI